MSGARRPPQPALTAPPTSPDGAPAGVLQPGDLLCAVDGRNTLLYRGWEDIRSELIGQPRSRVELSFLRRSVTRRGQYEVVKLLVSRGRRREVATEEAWPDPELYTDRALFLFTLRTPVRRLCIATVESTPFQRAVLLLITASTAVLASVDPLDSSLGVLGIASQVVRPAAAAAAAAAVGRATGGGRRGPAPRGPRWR